MRSAILLALVSLLPLGAMADDGYPRFMGHLTGDVIGYFDFDPGPSAYAMGLQGNGFSAGAGIRLAPELAIHGDFAYRALRRVAAAPSVLQLGTAIRWSPWALWQVTVVPQAVLLEVSDAGEDPVSAWGWGAELRTGYVETLETLGAGWAGGIGVAVSVFAVDDEVAMISALTLSGTYQ